MKEKIIIVLFIIIFSGCEQKDNTSSHKTTDFTVKTNEMQKQDVVRIHDIPAVLLATNRARLAFQLTGTVDKVLVKVGEQVEQGQILMGLYNPNLNPAVEGNLAKLESVKAKINQTLRDVGKLKELRKNNSASRNALEQKETALKDLYANKKSIQAQINLSQANQQESFIKAPFASTVVSVNKQLGEFVAAGQEVIVVNQADDLEVQVSLPKELWKSIKLNTRVLANYEQQIIEFNVIELAQMADAKSHLYKVILQTSTKLPNAIGQQVMLQLKQTYENVYMMPLEIVVDDGIDKPYIFSAVDNKAIKNPIKPLYIDGDDIVFTLVNDLQGLVVVKGQSKLSQGMSLNRQ